jgi:1,4-dihydroxy-2-naphthoate polyprenyltransferase
VSRIKTWVKAARPRTLPLSISGIVTAAGLANYYGGFDPYVFVLSVWTTIGFQVTSNFANDYGDGVKGTDNEDRIGPQRALQSGSLSPSALKKGIIISVLITVFFVLALLYVAFGSGHWRLFFLFLGLAAFSIWAAIRYTVGESAYGYRGLGDVFVFLFFGLVGVSGALFLHTKTVPPLSILMAVAVGLLSVGVLNLNNLRDFASDKKAGKNTMVVKLGFAQGKRYHLFLMVTAFASTALFLVLTFRSGWEFITLLAFLPIGAHTRRVQKAKDSFSIDPELKKLALSTFLLALLFYFSYNNFS